MNVKYQKYLEYIRNSGGSPSIEWFDEDWEPIGLLVREQMKVAGLIREQNNQIFECQPSTLPRQEDKR